LRRADVKAVQEKLDASQAVCALMIGVSGATLRNWELGRRTPDGPALALLRVAVRNPRAVAEALHSTSRMVAADDDMEEGAGKVEPGFASHAASLGFVWQ
jgi:DNA-binding transcriptional regulator YiaG